MGSLILCHSKRAKRPYEISRVHIRVYTIEELCYYICNNLYLVDYTIMNRGLCDWLYDELELKDMGEELRRELEKIFIGGEGYQNLFITVLSFGFKYGIPSDADLVFDVRFLPNPYYVDCLREHTGEEAEVQAYVHQGGTADIFLKKLFDMLEFLIPNYIQEGKNQLVVAIGCTGGKHRSVTVANALYHHLSGHKDIGLKIEHRDIDKDRKQKA